MTLPTSAGLEACQHLHLAWQSGGFYIGCLDCHAQWVAKKSGGKDTDTDHGRSARSALIPPSRAGEAVAWLPDPIEINEIRTLVYDSLDLSEELRTECANEVASAIARTFSSPQAVAPTGEIGELVANALAEVDALEQYGSASSRAIRPALTALSAERDDRAKWAAEWHGRYVVAEAESTDLRRKLEALERRFDLELDAYAKDSDMQALRNALREARDHINRYADAAVEHDLVARIDALTGGGDHG